MDLNSQKYKYLVPSKKPYKPAGYWSNHDIFIYTLMVVAMVVGIIACGFFVISYMNRVSVEKWQNMTKQCEINMRIQKDTILQYEEIAKHDNQCSLSRFYSLYQIH